MMFRVPVLKGRSFCQMFRVPVLKRRALCLMFRVPVLKGRSLCLMFRVPVLKGRFFCPMFRVPPLVFKEGSWTTMLELSHNVTGLQAIRQTPKVKANESAVTAENTLSIHTGDKRCLSSESFTSQPLRAVLLPHSSQRCSTLLPTRSCC